MNFQKANETDFSRIQAFYWDVIDEIHKNNTKNENLGWEKGAYPSDAFLSGSIQNGELYTLTDGETLCACVILNSACNEGYTGCTDFSETGSSVGGVVSSAVVFSSSGEESTGPAVTGVSGTVCCASPFGCSGSVSTLCSGSAAGSSSGCRCCSIGLKTASVLAVSASVSITCCTAQEASESITAASRKKRTIRFISDTPQRTLAAFQTGSRPSDRKGRCGSRRG